MKEKAEIVASELDESLEREKLEKEKADRIEEDRQRLEKEERKANKKKLRDARVAAEEKELELATDDDRAAIEKRQV